MLLFKELNMEIRIIIYLFIFTLLTQTEASDSTKVDFEVKVSKILMGTVVETTARYPDINHCKQSLLKAYLEMERVENLLSYHKPSSEISKINDAAGKYPVPISIETFNILRRSVGYAKKLNGLFDITIGPVSSLWDFSSPEGGHLPDRTDIDDKLKKVNYHDLILNSKDTTAYLKKAGMMIDLGGIAKGYAIDCGSAVLKENGINNFILNAGGDIYVSGQKDKNNLWKVGIKDPRNNQNLIARFDLKDYAAATSGDYERFIIVDGKRYCHIFDPHTGYPGNKSQSSTTFAATAEEADVLATYLFLIGAKQALNENFSRPFLIVGTDGRDTSNQAFKNLPGLKLELPVAREALSD
ncbi:MAG: FAD:protein FMN transferase [Calditrichaceae bacterium]